MTIVLLERLKNRRLIIDILAMFFGIGAVLGANSIFLQLPLLVNDAPEGWRLPSDMALVTQLANVGPIVYSVYVKYTSRKRDNWLIYGLLCAGAAAMFSVAFLHEETLYVFGAERSIAVLGFLFAVALVGCTASLLFVPYMRNYRDIYLVSYLVGEGVSGFLSSVLALVQGVGGSPTCVNSTDPTSATQLMSVYPEPKFSTSVFFQITGFILVLSFTAFVMLSKIPADSPERVGLPENDKSEISSGEDAKSAGKMSRKTYVYLLAMIGTMSGLGFSVLAGIQSYSCLPYGNVAYHLAVTLGYMASPLTMCVGFFVKNPRLDVVNYTIGLIFALTGLVFYLAAMSPHPPLQHTFVGELVVVAAWVALNGLIGFVRLTITTLFRTDSEMGLYHSGIATQVGAFTGAVISYCLINYAELFVTYSPCEHYLVAE